MLTKQIWILNKMLIKYQLIKVVILHKLSKVSFLKIKKN